MAPRSFAVGVSAELGGGVPMGADLVLYNDNLPLGEGFEPR